MWQMHMVTATGSRGPMRHFFPMCPGKLARDLLLQAAEIAANEIDADLFDSHFQTKLFIVVTLDKPAQPSQSEPSKTLSSDDSAPPTIPKSRSTARTSGVSSRKRNTPAGKTARRRTSSSNGSREDTK